MFKDVYKELIVGNTEKEGFIGSWKGFGVRAEGFGFRVGGWVSSV